jgi:hypothetical protein
MIKQAERTDLRLEITVDIAQFVEFVHGGEHLADVEAGVFLLKHSRVIQECTEVATGNIFHGKIDELRILEGVEKPHEPWSLGRSEDVALHKNVANLRRISATRLMSKFEETDIPRPS